MLIKIGTLICVLGHGQNVLPTSVAKSSEEIFLAFTENVQTHAHMPYLKAITSWCPYLSFWTGLTREGYLVRNAEFQNTMVVGFE